MDLVFVDANVLYSKTLRDWTLLLSQQGDRFAVVSSQDCIVEALANLREQYPAADGGVIRQIGKSIEGALHDIVDDWPGGEIEGMPDKKDWHVVHAATHAQVKILVTDNMKDFAPVAASLCFDLYSPDDLFMLLAANDPPAVETVTLRQVEYWLRKCEVKKAKGEAEPKRLAQALRDAGAPKFARVIEETLLKLGGADAPDASSGVDFVEVVDSPSPESDADTGTRTDTDTQGSSAVEPSPAPAPSAN